MRYEWRHGPITQRQNEAWRDQPHSRWFWTVLEVWPEDHPPRRHGQSPGAAHRDEAEIIRDLVENFPVTSSKRPLPVNQEDRDDEFIPFVPEEPGRYPTPRISREAGERILAELREKYPEHFS